MSATPERSTAAALSVRSSASVPAASPAVRMASASVAARRVKVTVSLSVPTDRALWRSYRPPRSRRSRSSMTWRSSCRAWSTCPGAWPRLQLSATRALYRGPEGSGADRFGGSDTVGTARQLAWHTRQRTEPAGAPILPSRRLSHPQRVAPTARRHVRDIVVALDEIVVLASPFAPNSRGSPGADYVPAWR